MESVGYQQTDLIVEEIKENENELPIFTMRNQLSPERQAMKGKNLRGMNNKMREDSPLIGSYFKHK